MLLCRTRLRWCGVSVSQRELVALYCAADAMYTPVATRFRTYGVALDPTSQAYVDAVLAWPAFLAWRKEVLEEPWIIAEDEV